MKEIPMLEKFAAQSLVEHDGELIFSKEKFAELIVRECVKVMYDNAIERKVPPDINQTPTHYAIAVLEHFGVE